MQNLSRMREEQFLANALQMGSLLIAETIVMFFVVLAFRKDSVTVPALFKWAVALLGASLLLPVVAMLINISSVSGGSSSRGGETAMFLMIAAAASPLLFFASITLALFALLPWGRPVHPSTPGQPPRPAAPVAAPQQVAEKPAEKHPLD